MPLLNSKPFNSLLSMLRRTISITVLTILYSFTTIIAIIGQSLIRKHQICRKRIIINGTFHNPNWFFAHIEPIVRSGYGEIILVCDEPIAYLPGLSYACPPSWATRIFSRAGAKFLWTLGIGLRRGADLFMGYHIFPSAITALICARLLGAKAAYQVTSGPLELEGGGWNAENKLLISLGQPSILVEKLAFSVTRKFDLVVVRGSKAANFIRNEVGYRHHLEVITGSVDTSNRYMQATRDIDVIFVGRLTEYKRPDLLIEVLAKVAQTVPTLRAVIVGDGPESSALQTQAAVLGLKDHIEFLGKRADIPELMGRSRVFVLTSRWEGVSIAMLEAMALGVVPVVSDVGDLNDFVKNHNTGFIIADNITGFSEHISQLLCDETLRTRLAQKARERIISCCDRKILAQRWNQVLTETIYKTEKG
jgi:L-malate glycosyltransferase